MDEQELIEIKLQVPAGQVNGISRLIEQLRLLFAEHPDGRAEIPVESDENKAFDLDQFQLLRQDEEEISVDGDLPPERTSHTAEAPSLPAADTPAEPAAGIAPAAPAQPDAAGVSIPFMDMPEALGTPAVPPQTLPLDALAAEDPAATLQELPDAPVVSSATSEIARTAGKEVQRLQEILTEAGPAPLTAEAVSLAFRRDDRRYDNGFPLY